MSGGTIHKIHKAYSFCFVSEAWKLLNITARSGCGFRSWKKHSGSGNTTVGFFNSFFLGVFPPPMLVVEKQFEGF